MPNANSDRAESEHNTRYRSISSYVSMPFVMRRAHLPRSSAAGGGCSTRNSRLEKAQWQVALALRPRSASERSRRDFAPATATSHCAFSRPRYRPRGHFQTLRCAKVMPYVSFCACSSPAPAIRSASAVCFLCCRVSALACHAQRMPSRPETHSPHDEISGRAAGLPPAEARARPSNGHELMH